MGMRPAAIFWALLASTLALYSVIVFWSLPQISLEADGITPFDMRPRGYDLEEARAFLLALSDTGRHFYLGTQHLLDWIYPALLGTTFAFGFSLLFRRPVLWLLFLLSTSVVGFDWLENLAVSNLLRADPLMLDTDSVAIASRWSVLKSAATTLAWVALLSGGGFQLFQRLRAQTRT
jgi:hypothetical protein